tara:strand:- start:663 stop:1055 length:393 start_codon:yes stop_codon:yes gene_type:complete
MGVATLISTYGSHFGFREFSKLKNEFNQSMQDLEVMLKTELTEQSVEEISNILEKGYKTPKEINLTYTDNQKKMKAHTIQEINKYKEYKIAGLNDIFSFGVFYTFTSALLVTAIIKTTKDMNKRERELLG